MFLHFFNCLIPPPFTDFSLLAHKLSMFFPVSWNPAVIFFWLHLYSLCRVCYQCFKAFMIACCQKPLGSPHLSYKLTPTLPFIANKTCVFPEMRLMSWLTWVPTYSISFSPPASPIFTFCPFFLQCLRSDISSPFPLMLNNKNNNSKICGLAALGSF